MNNKWDSQYRTSLFQPLSLLEEIRKQVLERSRSAAGGDVVLARWHLMAVIRLLHGGDGWLCMGCSGHFCFLYIESLFFSPALRPRCCQYFLICVDFLEYWIFFNGDMVVRFGENCYWDVTIANRGRRFLPIVEDAMKFNKLIQ